MTTKHTPGPWVNRPEMVTDGHWTVSAQEGTSNIALVYGTKLSTDPKHPMNQTAAANARLIAAAPELLEACRSMLDWMEFTIPKLPRLGDKCPKCNEPVSIHSMNWGGPISKARNAISKASGNGGGK